MEVGIGTGYAPTGENCETARQEKLMDIVKLKMDNTL